MTSAFSPCGAKLFQLAGIAADSWPYRSSHTEATALTASVTRDVTSVMDAGIVRRTMAAAALAGRYAPVWRVCPYAPLAAAVTGGLMLGYGARLAYGCNISAYFSGIVSGSLHG